MGRCDRRGLRIRPPVLWNFPSGSALHGSPATPVDDVCLERDWVPAIENELIDTSGNQYEESYKHYLNQARVAADEARRMREQLMNDIVEQAHKKAVTIVFGVTLH